ncbi:MAG TPA: protease pro-enzyme activation domain-containing protein, partial [Candidatus Solibacter sp.]|nr:protease pro-enzyme activation domain-containing protein [Candidatus Solibacter sp.]
MFHPKVLHFSLCLLAVSSFLRPAILRAQNAPAAAARLGPIDESARVVLRGNRHPLATAANDRGVAAPDLPMDRMLLVLKRDAAAQSALDRLVLEQQDRSSPSFHNWLTPAQLGRLFGPSQSDLQKVTAWLASHGFRVGGVARSG